MIFISIYWVVYIDILHNEPSYIIEIVSLIVLANKWYYLFGYIWFSILKPLYYLILFVLLHNLYLSNSCNWLTLVFYNAQDI